MRDLVNAGISCCTLKPTQDWRILSRFLLLQRVTEHNTCIELPLNKCDRAIEVLSSANEATGNERVGVQNRMKGEELDWATSPFVDVISLDWSVLRMDQ